ncbi:MAG: antitoxin VapB family protein [Candidatus Diapherotrites archaeon]|nr:antitoxin VapB family protein [Candidatus Diapherotrites archaeon]
MISVADKTYDRLKTYKGEQSFTKAVDELLDKSGHEILQFAGALKEDWNGIDTQKWVRELRASGRAAHEKKMKRLEKLWKD